MLVGMSGEKRKDFREFETMEEAARRLIGVMDERKKRRLAGGLEGPAEIRNQPAVSPAKAENGGQSPSACVGSAALKSSGRQSTPPRGGNGDDHVANHGQGGSNGLVAGGVDGLLRARIDVAMRPPAQPCAGSNSDGFTIDAGGTKAQNVRTVGD